MQGIPEHSPPLFEICVVVDDRESVRSSILPRPDARQVAAAAACRNQVVDPEVKASRLDHRCGRAGLGAGLTTDQTG